MTITDAASKDWVNVNATFLHWLAPICGALLVIVAGKWLAAKARAKIPGMVDLADDVDKRL